MYDWERGPGSTVSGNIIFDQDDATVDDAEGLPSVDSTPRRRPKSPSEPVPVPEPEDPQPRSTATSLTNSDGISFKKRLGTLELPRP